MRKPANQVASIDDVNAKQDKLDYTPANDANVVHRNPDTGTVNESANYTKGLQTSGFDVLGTKTLSSSDDYLNQSNDNPNVLFIVKG
ncbi:hypothetical protein LbDm2_0007 [Levilactobacillus brevis]|nr:hypothetical protein LbDm2_0007 [Levilactobacillus brevis]